MHRGRGQDDWLLVSMEVLYTVFVDNNNRMVLFEWFSPSDFGVDFFLAHRETVYPILPYPSKPHPIRLPVLLSSWLERNARSLYPPHPDLPL